MEKTQNGTSINKKKKYDNAVGQKIQTISGFACLIGIIVSVFYGIILILGGLGLNNAAGGIAGITGIVVAAIGSAASWACGTILYGFGLLIEDVQLIANSMSKFSMSNQFTKQDDM